MDLHLHLDLTDDGLRLTAQVPDTDISAAAEVKMPHEPARQSQAENIQRQLSRLGNTVYEAALVTMGEGTAEVFIPSSRLADLRRQAIAALDDAIATPRPVCGDDIATTTTTTPPA